MDSAPNVSEQIASNRMDRSPRNGINRNLHLLNIRRGTQSSTVKVRGIQRWKFAAGDRRRRKPAIAGELSGITIGPSGLFPRSIRVLVNLQFVVTVKLPSSVRER